MKSILGFAFLLLGIGIIVFGMSLALRPVINMYSEALNNPMGSDPAADSGGGQSSGGDAQSRGGSNVGGLSNVNTTVPNRMFHGIAIAAAGLVPLIAGTVLIKIAIFQKIRNRMRASSARSVGAGAKLNQSSQPTTEMAYRAPAPSNSPGAAKAAGPQPVRLNAPKSQQPNPFGTRPNQ